MTRVDLDGFEVLCLSSVEIALLLQEWEAVVRAMRALR
jgi:hypothetical protein